MGKLIFRKKNGLNCESEEKRHLTRDLGFIPGDKLFGIHTFKNNDGMPERKKTPSLVDIAC